MIQLCQTARADPNPSNLINPCCTDVNLAGWPWDCIWTIFCHSLELSHKICHFFILYFEKTIKKQKLVIVERFGIEYAS